MTHVDELQGKIDFWRSRLSDAERDQERAGLLVTDFDDTEAAISSLKQSTVAAQAARQAIELLEAKRPAAQARDLLAEADALDAEADALEAQAAPIGAEVDRLIAAAAVLGVNLARRGDPQRDLTLLEQARAQRGHARERRAKAAKLRSTQ